MRAQRSRVDAEPWVARSWPTREHGSGKEGYIDDEERNTQRVTRREISPNCRDGYGCCGDRSPCTQEHLRGGSFRPEGYPDPHLAPREFPQGRR